MGKVIHVDFRRPKAAPKAVVERRLARYTTEADRDLAAVVAWMGALLEQARKA